MLALLHAEDDGRLGEEGGLLAKVSGRVEAQRPPGGALDVVEDVNESVDGHLARRRLGAVGQPDLDTAVVVGEGLEGVEAGGALGAAAGGGLRRGWALETDADALCWAASGGVEDVACDGVLS